LMARRRPGPDHLRETGPGSAEAGAHNALPDGRPLQASTAVPQPHPSRSPAVRVVFWEALDPIERDAFRAVASYRIFAAGARLIAEGDQADHVIVILSGRTKICVEENDGERVLAERGPGQLVGERAVLQLSLRSASVIALDRVQALVVTVGDFAAFISAHPRVLGIVESQLYDRHTEDPTRYGPDILASFSVSKATAADWLSRSLSGRRQRQYPQALNGENCTIILSDVVGFGARARTDEDRRVIREALFSMTHTALQDLPDVWSWDDRGDGLLTVVPPSVPTAKVVGHLHKELPAALEEHNRAHRDSAQIQLRVAINVGPVITDAIGVSGEAIIVAARLVEALPFKEAMKNSQADLGIIASAFIHETVIRHDLGLMGYAQVQVDVKESSFLAWMKLFGPAGGSGRETRDWRRLLLIDDKKPDVGKLVGRYVSSWRHGHYAHVRHLRVQPGHHLPPAGLLFLGHSDNRCLRRLPCGPRTIRPNQPARPGVDGWRLTARGNHVKSVWGRRGGTDHRPGPDARLRTAAAAEGHRDRDHADRDQRP
jgi:CRP-like cAMP-binding protein